MARYLKKGATYDANAPLNADDPLISDLENEEGGGGLSYSVYTALLNQSGTDAPVATVLENTLGGTVVWTRSATGNYRATLSGAFPAAKTFVSVTQSADNYSGFTYVGRLDNNEIGLFTFDDALASVDEDLINRSFEIRVYP